MACGIFCTFPIISVLAPISYPSHLHSDNKWTKGDQPLPDAISLVSMSLLLVLLTLLHLIVKSTVSLPRLSSYYL